MNFECSVQQKWARIQIKNKSGKSIHYNTWIYIKNIVEPQKTEKVLMLFSKDICKNACLMSAIIAIGSRRKRKRIS